eukprot:5362348-Pyramimonas_sp.AAC.1
MTVANYKKIKGDVDGSGGGAAAPKKQPAKAKSAGIPRIDAELFSGTSTLGEDVKVQMRWGQPSGKPKVRLCCIR